MDFYTFSWKVWDGWFLKIAFTRQPEIQNSTLAGGVAAGTAATMMIKPYGAILIGMVSGTVSTFGFIYLTPFLERKIYLHDTAG